MSAAPTEKVSGPSSKGPWEGGLFAAAVAARNFTGQPSVPTTGKPYLLLALSMSALTSAGGVKRSGGIASFTPTLLILISSCCPPAFCLDRVGTRTPPKLL